MSIDPNVVPVFNEEGWGTFYKFVDAEDNCSPYYGMKYAPGVLVSTRESKLLNEGETEAKLVNAGVHVILNHPDLYHLLDVERFFCYMRIIKILAHQDHLVAAGWWWETKAAVFTQVTVPDDFELEVIEGMEVEEDDYDDLEDEWDDIEDEEDSWDDEEEDL